MNPMKFLAAGFLCIFLPLAAGAETVMLYTEEPVGKGDVKKSRGYMEDGIMGAFFDAGHIIFNSHADEDKSDGEAAVQELFGDRNWINLVTDTDLQTALRQVVARRKWV